MSKLFVPWIASSISSSRLQRKTPDPNRICQEQLISGLPVRVQLFQALSSRTIPWLHGLILISTHCSSCLIKLCWTKIVTSLCRTLTSSLSIQFNFLFIKQAKYNQGTELRHCLVGCPRQITRYPSQLTKANEALEHICTAASMNVYIWGIQWPEVLGWWTTHHSLLCPHSFLLCWKMYV